MPISLTRSAWVGIRNATTEDTLALRIDGILAGDPSPRPVGLLSPGLLLVLARCYREWSRGNRLIGG